MQPVATKSNDEKLQEQIRSLAQEVLSEISELEPSRSKELLGGNCGGKSAGDSVRRTPKTVAGQF